MPRADMADHLVRFMAGAPWVDAFGTMQRTLHQRLLRGSGRINAIAMKRTERAFRGEWLAWARQRLRAVMRTTHPPPPSRGPDIHGS